MKMPVRDISTASDCFTVDSLSAGLNTTTVNNWGWRRLALVVVVMLTVMLILIVGVVLGTKYGDKTVHRSRQGHLQGAIATKETKSHKTTIYGHELREGANTDTETAFDNLTQSGLQDPENSKGDLLTFVRDEVSALVKEELSIMSEVSDALNDLQSLLLNMTQDESQDPDTSEANRNSCPEDFFLVGNKCYLVGAVTLTTWEDARKDCQQRGGDLAIIHEPWKFITAERIRNIPLGVVFVGGWYKDNAWRWLSGEVIGDDFLWSPNYPNDGKCMTLSEYTIRFTSVSCSAYGGYVCGL